MYYQNAPWLRSKTKHFRIELMKNSFDVILLCETSLNDDFFDSALFYGRYIIYRCDRDRGCLITVKKQFSSKRLRHFELNKEDVWVSVEHLNGNKTFFNVRYIELGSDFLQYAHHFDKSMKISCHLILTIISYWLEIITWVTGWRGPINPMKFAKLSMLRAKFRMCWLTYCLCVMLTNSIESGMSMVDLSTFSFRTLKQIEFKLRSRRIP